MALSEKELEKQLMEAGNALLFPPAAVSELLSLLDRAEKFLTQVEQSPSESMKKAFSPSMKALIADDLVKHSDIDVKVSVASCISEITRITAPDAPYEDDQMKEVFQLIVSSFEKLDDTNSLSYIKRTSILETVAKVRSCVVMLDLECDSLIAEMFQHFLRSIREYHPENVFSSMETIMTLVLEESEDISVDLLASILDFLKIDKEVLPIARQLAEKVVEKCASKLKPYLLPAVKSRGNSVHDYSKVVANVFQMGSEATEAIDGDAASKNVVEESDMANAPTEKPVEVAMETLDDAPPSEEVGPTTAVSPKSIMSNGNVRKEIQDSSAIIDDSKEEDRNTNVGVKMDVEPSKPNAESSDAEELAKSESNKAERSNKRKGRSISSSKGSSEPSEPSLTDKEAIKKPKLDSKSSSEPSEHSLTDKEAVKKRKLDAKSSSEPSESSLADKEAFKKPKLEDRESKDGDSAHSKDTVADATEPFENDKESDALVSSPKTSENQPADAPSPSPSGRLVDDNHSKKGGRAKTKDDLGQETELAGDVESKKESHEKKTTEDASVTESKTQKQTGKKASSSADKEDNITSADIGKKENEDTPKLDTKSTKQSGKKVEAVSIQREDKKKRGQAKGTPAKDTAKTPSRDEGQKPVSKTAAKSSKDESPVDKASKTGSKRKQSPGEEKASETKSYGAELVGSKIKVWWPHDKTYYEGVVESFDSVKMRHKVVYVDGDVEILKLAKERWELIDDDSLPDQGHASDAESPDESAETPKGKKGKTSVDLGSKRGKFEISAKKDGASSSKSKITPKSGRKQKDDNKAEIKAKEEAAKSSGKSNEDKAGKSKDLKAGIKSSEEASKSAAKSKDDNVGPKGSNKSKQETPKGATKSKGKSPKASAKSNTSGTGKGKASSLLKEEEPEDPEESPEPAKAPEPTKGKSPSAYKSQKSGKKRKRGGKG